MIVADIMVATQAHAAAMAAIHAASFPPAERWGEAAIATQLGQPGVFALVIPASALIIARVAADEAEILTLAVHPSARRQGQGMALLRAALRRAATRAVYLEVSNTNAAARGLYQRAGFVEVGQRRRYYADGSDASVLRFTTQASITCPGAAEAG